MKYFLKALSEKEKKKREQRYILIENTRQEGKEKDAMKSLFPNMISVVCFLPPPSTKQHENASNCKPL